MDSYFSQWVYDTFGIISAILLWFPLLLGFFFLLFYCVYACIQDEHLKRDYLKSISEEDRKVIFNFLENTSYFRVKRRLRRIKKNLIDKK